MLTPFLFKLYFLLNGFLVYFAVLMLTWLPLANAKADQTDLKSVDHVTVPDSTLFVFLSPTKFSTLILLFSSSSRSFLSIDNEQFSVHVAPVSTLHNFNNNLFCSLFESHLLIYGRQLSRRSHIEDPWCQMLDLFTWFGFSCLPWCSTQTLSITTTLNL